MLSRGRTFDPRPRAAAKAGAAAALAKCIFKLTNFLKERDVKYLRNEKKKKTLLCFQFLSELVWHDFRAVEEKNISG